MKEALFQELVESGREGGAILRSEVVPSRALSALITEKGGID